MSVLLGTLNVVIQTLKVSPSLHFYSLLTLAFTTQQVTKGVIDLTRITLNFETTIIGRKYEMRC